MADDPGSQTLRSGSQRTGRRTLLRGRILARRIGRSRSAKAAADLGRAIRADAGDLAGALRRRAPALRQVDWKGQGVRIGAAARALPARLAGLRLSPIRSGMPNGRGRLRRRHAVACTLLAIFFGAAGTLVWALRDLPFSTVLENTSEPVVLMEAADGEALVRRGPFKKSDEPLSAYPQHLVDAVISIEDRRFYSHPGVDPLGVARALGRNLGAGEVVEGGSTISQQLVKILHLERDRTYGRKIREAALALWMDARLSKDEILNRYLNQVYMGAGATGMSAAAQVYFDKEVAELTLAESALLAGLIQAPSQLNPLRDLDAARARAALVLDSMVANGKIEPQLGEASKAEPATLSPARLNSPSGSWFADWVAEEAAEIAGPFQGTMRVRTTLVPSLQRLAEGVVQDVLENEGGSVGASQAALVAMRPDGAVVAMVGGRNYGTSEFNRAVQSMRQPGSTFKLFVYYAALRQGMSPRDRIQDAPLEIDGWTPENSDGRFSGRVSLAEAFARSLNAATVRLAMDVGLPEVVAAARDLGLDAPLAETPSLALGSSEVSLIDLTGAYASVRAGVTPIEPWGITGFAAEDQPRLFRLGPSVEPQRSLLPHQEPLVGMLKLVVDRGTGRGAALDGFAAGKTGTSQNYRDAWFVGFNEALVVGVWVGNDDGAPMERVTGGRLPALIWKNFMTQATEGVTSGSEAVESDAPAASSAQAEPATDAPPQCNFRACSRAYRSFRASDCTFQPYRSRRRRLCER